MLVVIEYGIASSVGGCSARCRRRLRCRRKTSKAPAARSEAATGTAIATASFDEDRPEDAASVVELEGVDSERATGDDAVEDEVGIAPLKLVDSGKGRSESHGGGAVGKPGHGVTPGGGAVGKPGHGLGRDGGWRGKFGTRGMDDELAAIVV